MTSILFLQEAQEMLNEDIQIELSITRFYIKFNNPPPISGHLTSYKDFSPLQTKKGFRPTLLNSLAKLSQCRRVFHMRLKSS